MFDAISMPDLVVAVLCGFLAVRGAFKGFAWTAVRTIGLIAAVVAGFTFWSPVSAWMTERIQFIPEPATPAVAFFVIFVGVLLVATFFAWMARGAVRTVQLTFMDRVFGFVLGAVMGLVFLTVAFLFLGTAVPGEKLYRAMEGSLSVRAMAELVEFAEPALPEGVRAKWRESIDRLKEMGDQSSSSTVSKPSAAANPSRSSCGVGSGRSSPRSAGRCHARGATATVGAEAGAVVEGGGGAPSASPAAYSKRVHWAT